MLEQRVAAVLAGLEHAGVRLGAEREPVGPVDPRAAQGVDRLGDVARVALAVVAERDRVVGRGLGDAGDLRRRPSRGRRPRSRRGDLVGGLVERARSTSSAPRSASSSSERATVNGARSSTSGSTRRCRGADAVRRGAGERPRSGRGWWPSAPSRAGPAKSTSLRAARAGVSRSRASASSRSQPASVIGACVAEQVAHGALRRRLPMPSDSLPASGAPRAACVLGRLLLGLLAVLDDVALLEEDSLARSRATAACGAAGTRGPCRSA